MGRVSLRRETIFRDWAIGSNSSRDLWIACSSSRVASSLSIRRLIVCGNLLDRRMVQNITLLSAESRYASGHTRNEIFRRQVADWREVWSLWNDDWVLMGDKDGEEMIPVWPDPLFAEAFWFISNPFSDRMCSTTSPIRFFLGLPAWRRTIAPWLCFLLQKTKRQRLSPLKLKRDIEEELAKYE
jgi:hypothetical protein